MATTQLQLPDECWESVFKFLTNSDAGDNNHRHFESLSAVSKQFLSITNHLKRSFTISDPTLPFLSRLFHRFPNLTSLNLTRISNHTNLDALLIQISNSPFPLKSLNLSNQQTIPLNGLRIFSKKITTLTSLTCSNITSLRNNDTLFISNFFPFLEELDLSNPKDIEITDIVVNSMSIKLPKLRKVNFSGHYYINDTLFFHLCKNCEFLEEAVMFKCSFITNDGIASAIRERPGLRSLSFNKLRLFGGNDNFFDSLVILKGLSCIDLSYSCISDEFLSAVAEKGLPLRKLVLQGCFGYSFVGIFCLLSNCRFLQHLDLQNAEFLNDWHVVELSSFLGDLVSINISKCSGLTDFALFTFVTKCASLSEVRMEYTSIGKKCVENSYTLMNFVVNPQLKSLRLAHNTWLRDEDINKFASIFPNLQLLDLSSCNGISEKGIGQVLRKCSKIRHLNLACCSGLKLLRMDFQVSTLEVLNLSESGIDDRSLDMISKSCFGLLQLDLGRCFDVTEKGVRQVVVNCTKLREINLHGCCKVAADVVDSMVFIRPSLRKITAPPGFHCSDSKRKLFLRHGCLVC